jgi:hypothetical protein
MQNTFVVTQEIQALILHNKLLMLTSQLVLVQLLVLHHQEFH